MALFAVFALVAASCGDDDDDDSAPSTATQTQAPDPEPAPDPDPEETAEPEEAPEPEPDPEETAEPAPEPEPEPEETAEPLQVAYLSASSANTWLLASRQQMETVAAANNVELTEFDAQFDPGLQATQFQDVIASGNYDGVVLVAITGIATAPDIADALDAGLEVVTLNQVVGEDYTTKVRRVPGD
ncbi:MAG: substrate-binding domain-containing protein, partial [Acidimicrobiaceae bacterium]|nr:substrate-binding domain-containing protein [Acidimicrobiaceae bacterium]